MLLTLSRKDSTQILTGLTDQDEYAVDSLATIKIRR